MKDYILVIDTSSMLGLCALALREKDSIEVISSKYIDAKSSHSEMLFLGIQEVMEDASVSICDVGLIAFTVGPGSFTGLRIAYSAAVGISLALGTKLYGVSTLKAIMYNLRDFNASRCVLIKGSREEVYALACDETGNVLIKEGNYTIGEVIEKLSETGGEVICVGSGASAYMNELSKIKNVIVPSDQNLHIVSPYGILSLLDSKGLQGINYLKASYAETGRKMCQRGH